MKPENRFKNAAHPINSIKTAYDFQEGIQLIIMSTSSQSQHI